MATWRQRLASVRERGTLFITTFVWEAVEHETATLRADHEARLSALEQAVEAGQRPPASATAGLGPASPPDREELARHVRSFAGCAVVLDLGCGDGDFLALLREAGVSGIGAESEADSVLRCRAQGLVCHRADPLDHLADCLPSSADGIFSSGLVDRLEVTDIARLLALASTRLRPGGILLLRATDPRSLRGLQTLWLDPTAARPVHPELLRRLAERYGLQDVQVLAPSDLTDIQPVPALPAPAGSGEQSTDRDGWDAFNAGIARINDVLFASQSYAIAARRSG